MALTPVKVGGGGGDMLGFSLYHSSKYCVRSTASWLSLSQFAQNLGGDGWSWKAALLLLSFGGGGGSGLCWLYIYFR